MCYSKSAVFSYLLNSGFSSRVERSRKVGRVGLKEASSSNGVCVVISVDTASSEDTDVNTTLFASIGQVKSTDDIATDGGSLVIFTPVDIRATCTACTVQDMCRLDSLQFLDDCLSIFHTYGGGVDCLTLIFEQGL